MTLETQNVQDCHTNFFFQGIVEILFFICCS